MNTTQTTPADVLATYFASWRDRDFESLRSILADEVTFSGPLGTAANAEECVQGIERLAQITTDVVVQKTFADGPDVLTWFELHTKIAPPAQVANWSRVEDGKIVRIRVTFDPRAMLAQG
jgi:ketosteroid isomerase-like protein